MYQRIVEQVQQQEAGARRFDAAYLEVMDVSVWRWGLAFCLGILASIAIVSPVRADRPEPDKSPLAASAQIEPTADAVFEKVFLAAREYTAQHNRLRDTEGVSAARAKGLEIRLRLAALCDAQLETNQSKDDHLKARCTDVRQEVDRALGDLKNE